MWGSSGLGGAGVPEAGQSMIRELDGQGSGQGSALLLSPEEALGVQQALLTAAPSPPQHAIAFCLKESGNKPPMVMYAPSLGSQEAPSLAPAAGLAARRQVFCLLLLSLPLLQAGPLPSHSGSGDPELPTPSWQKSRSSLFQPACLPTCGGPA